MKKFLPLYLSVLVFLITLGFQSIFLNKLEPTASDNSPSNLLKGDLITTKGKILNFEKLRPKYLIVNFWAYWCGPCLKEIPELSNLVKNYSRNEVFVIGIHGPDDGASRGILKLEDRNLFDYDLFYDNNDLFFRHYKIEEVPTTLVFKNNKLIKRFNRAINYKELEKVIES